MADTNSHAALRHGYADSSWGQLHYAAQGQGPALLLLHQTPRSWDEFREVMPLLAKDLRVVAMDMLGFGASARQRPRQTIEGMAAAAFELWDALRIDSGAVLGHHTGAAVAIEMAAARPDRVRALVLSSPPWTDAAYRASHAAGPSVDVAERAVDGSHLVQLWRQRLPYYPAPATGLLDRFIRDALAPGVDPAEGHRACARYAMEERIGKVTAPVLLLGAAADPFAMRSLEPVRAHLTSAPSMRTVVIDGGTIPLMEHKPHEVATAVLPFLGAVEQGAGR